MTSGEFILTLDATTLESTFLEKALPHFEESSVAAVSGTLTSVDTQSLTSRWRSRHLFMKIHQMQRLTVFDAYYLRHITKEKCY